jgi:hypothetical protein
LEVKPIFSINKSQKEVKPISSTHKYIERGKTDIINTQITESLSMYLCVQGISFISFYDLFVEDIGFTPYCDLCVEDIRFTTLCDLCVDDIRFTSFYIKRGKTDIFNTQIPNT